MRLVLTGTPSQLPLPKPWRLLFQGVEPLKTDGKQYALLCDLVDGCTKLLPAGQLEQWEVDQEEGTFFAALVDGKILNADVQFLGTHDGRDFQWADSNPSVRANLTVIAKKLRGSLPVELQALGRSEKLPISTRDTLALAGLAASICECDLVIAAPSGRTQIAMALMNVTFSDPQPERSIAKANLFSRFFGKKPAVAQTQSVADQLNALRQTVDVAMNQWQENLLSNEDLRALEPDLVRAYDTLQHNDAQGSLELLGNLQMRLGQFPQDQEPTGWIYLCEGIAATMLDDLPRARAALSVAARAIVPVPATILRLAKARASERGNVDHELKSAYLVSPKKFIEIAGPDEIAVVKAALNAANSMRRDDAPKAVLTAVIKHLYEVEVSAHSRSEKARETRETANILSSADVAATLDSNKEYADLLLKWATPHRSPELGSYSSNPRCDPNRIEDIQNLSQNNEVIEFLVTFKDQFPNSVFQIQYTLRKTAMPLTNEHLWRLDRITDGLDHDPFVVF